MKISVFGLGYVGGTSLACLAELGHEVIGVDVNPDKVAMVNEGQSPVFEPGVSELLSKHRQAGAVRATADHAAAVAETEVCLVCVGTPSTIHGALDDRHLINVVTQIGEVRKSTGRVNGILVRSTALPAIHRHLMTLLRERIGGDQPLAYCVHPEFLRTGRAIYDFMNPAKIVFGCSDEVAAETCRQLYPGINATVTFTDPMTAAMVKYADNCFHAVKVTFANEIGMLCKAMRVDSRKVMELFCQDTKLNISSYYLRPGFAFGGSCLPKDVRAAMAWSRQNMVTLPMLDHVLTSNDIQISRLLGRILEDNVRSVGVFGLAFKEGTDDVRESPMVTLSEHLIGKGRKVVVYDPYLSIARMVGSNLSFALRALPHLASILVDDPAEVVKGSELVIISRNFKEINWTDLPWREEQLVLDVIGTGECTGIDAKVEGLYWD
jgi:GDP-mannose 6-dehydrogenase